MALNNLGLGFTISAKDLASPTLSKIITRLQGLAAAAQNVSASGGISGAILGNAGALGAASAALTGTGAALSTVGHGVERVGSALIETGMFGVSALNDATKVAAEFNKEMGQVETIVDTTKVNMMDLRQAVMRTGQQFGGSMVDQTKAMYQAFSTGARDASEASAMLTAANKLAVGGNTSTEKSLLLLANTLNSYGRAFTEQNLTDVTDSMFVAIKDGTTTAEQLTSSMGRVTPVAVAAGLSIDQLMASMAAATHAGLSTREVATGMRAALLNIIRPAQKATAEAKRLGIQFDFAALKSKGFPELLKEITTNSKFNGETLGKLFRSYTGLTTVLALTKGGMADFTRMLGDMETKHGLTQRAVDIMAQKLSHTSGVFDTLQYQVETVIGEAFTPLKIALLSLANDAMTWFLNLSPDMQQNILYIAGALSGMAIAVGVVLVVLGGFMAMLGTVMMVIGGLIAAVLAAAAAWVIFDLTLAGVAMTGGILLGVMVALAAVAIWAGLAIAAFFAGMYVAWTNNIGGIADKVKEFADNVRLVFSTVGTLLSTGGILTGEARTAFEGAPKIVQDAVIGIYVWVERVKGFFTGIFDGFSQGLAVAQPAIDSFTHAWERLVAAITPAVDAPDEAKEKYSSWADMGAYVGKVFARMFEFVLNVVNAIINITTGLIEGWDDVGLSVEQTTGIFGGLIDAVTELFASFMGSSNATTKGVSGWETFGRVIGWVVGILAQVTGFTISFLSMLISIASGIIAAIVDVIVGAYSIIVDVVKLIVALLTGDWKGAWEQAKNIVGDVAITIMNIVMDIVIGIAKAIDKIGGFFGKDLGLGASLEGTWQKQRADMATMIGGGTLADQAEAKPVQEVKKTEPPKTLAQMQTSLLASLNPTAAGAPGVAQAQQQGGLLSALAAGSKAKAAAPQQVTVNTKTQLVADSRVLAEVVTKAQKELGLLEGLPAE